MASFPPPLQEPVYKLLPTCFVLLALLARLSTKRVSPSVWSVVHEHAGSSEAMDGQAASWLQDHLLQLGGPPSRGERPGFWPQLLLGDNGQGVYLPAINF